MAEDFVHLHVHSDYSLLDGACKHDALIERIAELDMHSVAVTDHGNLFGAMEFYQKATKAGVRPILGCEIYVAPGDDPGAHLRRDTAQGEYSHLVLLCETLEGFRNLSKLVSRGYTEGFHYKPRVSKALLGKYARGLICTTACLKGEVPSHVLAGRVDLAKKAALELRSLFGERSFFLEIQENGLEEQREVNRALEQIAKELSIPLVATCDAHYLRKEDKRAHEALVAINTGKTLSDPGRLSFSGEYYLRSKQEMEELFRGREEALRATVEIARRCDVRFDFGARHLPVYRIPGGEAPESFLRRLCREGCAKRYGSPIPAHVEARLEEELGVIEQMGFASYFLITWDFIDWAKSRRIPVGPGRGSAAGSVVAYCLGITEIDPLRYDLLFERFLNKERISLPDIDVDFCQVRRGEVIEYVREKYGKEAVAQIITFGTMAARSVIRDVGRVLGIPLAEVDRVAKKVPPTLHIKLKEAIEQEPELRKVRDEDPRFKELFEIASKLEGFVRNASTHAAGVVIGDGPLEEHVPLYKDPRNPDDLVTQYSMGQLEECCGLLKMDFLGLKTLTVIEWCLDHIERQTGKRPDLGASVLPLDDAKTYALLQRGETKGVFQFESQGYRELLQRLKPDRFEDLIALGAMYRPGPLGAGMVEAYVARKSGREAVTYLHPLLEKVLGESYGCMLYQEQIMRIANTLAGFSLSEADTLRKAMGKKKPEVMARYRGKFVEGAVKRGCEAQVAERIWEQMEYFAGYGFNRSHSAAYALIAYRTAYLKANYPVEFMAALLSSEVSNVEKVVEYVEEAERMGIEVLPPDVEVSEKYFSVVPAPSDSGRKAIRYGLIAIRGLGERAIEAILEARARVGRFSGIYELCAEVDTRILTRAGLEALLKAGALRSFGARRSQLAAVIDAALQAGARAAQDRRAGQRSLFEAFSSNARAAPAFAASRLSPPLPDLPEWSEQEILQGEKESLGFYLTSHPLRKHRELILRYATARSRTLAEHAGREVVLAGMVQQLRMRPDKKGNLMAFATIEDLEGVFDAVIFARVFESVRAHLKPEAILFFKGTVDTVRETPSLLVEDAIPIERADELLAEEVCIRLRPAALADDLLGRLEAVLSSHPGSCPVVLEIVARSGLKARIRVGESLYVRPGAELVRAVEVLLGPGACVPRRAIPPDAPLGLAEAVEEPSGVEEPGELVAC